jgi:DNA/RNA endonuclease YhcR with UshA esterase domain
MQHRSNVATGAVFILVMMLCVLYVSTASGEIISIAEARQQGACTAEPCPVVSVQGWVTVSPCRFESFSFDCGFAIQDNSAGIYVSTLSLTPPPPFLTQKVRVTGCLKDSFGLLILSTDCPGGNIDALLNFKLIAPQEFTTGQIGEDTEGRLVRVVGTVTQPSQLDQDPVTGHIFGYRIFIDDGTGELQGFISVEAGINPLVPPFSYIIAVDHRIEVIGFSGQFQDHYEVNPRFWIDIRPVD